MATNETPQEGKQPKKKTKKSPDSKIALLGESLEKINSELETIRQNIQKRKSETTTLKVLFYTGAIVLLLGFVYSTSTIQRAQIESLESNISTLEHRLARELATVKGSLSRDIQGVRNDMKTLSRDGLPQILSRMNAMLEGVEPGNEKIAALIKQLQEDSNVLSEAYARQQVKLLKESGLQPSD